jgi:hypothetical protein
MVVAAKAIALSAVEAFADERLRAGIRQEFDAIMQGKSYRSLLPAEAKPAGR